MPNQVDHNNAAVQLPLLYKRIADLEQTNTNFYDCMHKLKDFSPNFTDMLTFGVFTPFPMRLLLETKETDTILVYSDKTHSWELLSVDSYLILRNQIEKDISTEPYSAWIKLAAPYLISELEDRNSSNVEVPKIGSTWLHDNGNEYTVICIANKDNRPLTYPRSVVYINSSNGEVYTRFLCDWHRSLTKISN